MKTILIRNKETKVQYVWQTENPLHIQSLPKEILSWILEEKAEWLWDLEGTGSKIKKEVTNRLRGENELLFYKEGIRDYNETQLITLLTQYFPDFKVGFTFSKQQAENFIVFLKEKYGTIITWGRCYNILRDVKLESYKSNGTTKYRVV